jgi:serine/threonine-protein kinase RsbW
VENYYNQLEIDSDPGNLELVESFVNKFAKDIGIDEEKLPGLLLSMTEAVTNAIKHANKYDKDKKVLIEVCVDSNILTLKIKDEGTGFDPDAIPDPTEPENLLKDSGRGLFLMRFYMKELHFNVTPSGTETTLVMDLRKSK